LRGGLGRVLPRDRGFKFLDVDLEVFDLGLKLSDPFERDLEFVCRAHSLHSALRRSRSFCVRSSAWVLDR
jgi:hypothetical protein